MLEVEQKNEHKILRRVKAKNSFSASSRVDQFRNNHVELFGKCKSFFISVERWTASVLLDFKP